MMLPALLPAFIGIAAAVATAHLFVIGLHGLEPDPEMRLALQISGVLLVAAELVAAFFASYRRSTWLALFAGALLAFEVLTMTLTQGATLAAHADAAARDADAARARIERAAALQRQADDARQAQIRLAEQFAEAGKLGRAQAILETLHQAHDEAPAALPAPAAAPPLLRDERLIVGYAVLRSALTALSGVAMIALAGTILRSRRDDPAQTAAAIPETPPQEGTTTTDAPAAVPAETIAAESGTNPDPIETPAAPAAETIPGTIPEDVELVQQIRDGALPPTISAIKAAKRVGYAKARATLERIRPMLEAPTGGLFGMEGARC